MDFKPAHLHTLFSVSAVTVFTVIGIYLYNKKKRNQLPKEWTAVGKVTDVFIYPLKSGRRIPLQTGECSDVGLKTEQKQNELQLRDRSFVVYGEESNEFKTARTYPKLLLIELSTHDKEHVIFDAPKQRTLYVKVPSAGKTKEVTISLHQKETTKTLDCGEEAAAWISRYILDKPSGLRLGFNDTVFKRDIRKAYVKELGVYDKLNNAATGIYSDLTSYLLLNNASVLDLNTKLDEPVTANNFRPNFLVEGDQLKAFEEENWDWIKIGDAVFRNVKPCTRCIFTTINPETAVRSENREPLKTLEKHNILKDPVHQTVEGQAPVMGIHLGLCKEGKLNVNDVVYVGKTEN